MEKCPENLIKRMNVVKHFNQRMISRSSGLLPMLYSPSELGHELGIPSRTLREWIKNGLPHKRDDKGFIWIHGVEFAAWVEQTRNAKSHIHMKRDEAFCLHCKQAVKIQDPKLSRRGKLTLMHGRCPTCGGAVSRGGRVDLSK
jgi:hypothetical protein